MKKNLFGNKKGFYKANLHAHSTGSDGKMPPLEMKNEFKKRGYSILSITEHEILKDYSYLSDEDFLFINGYEYSINENEGEDWNKGKCCHLNLYAKNKSVKKNVCFNPESIWFAGEDVKSKVEYIGEIYQKNYSAECVNEVIKTAKANGFIVCLNHPAWSMEEPSDYLNYDGLFALEIYNTDCAYWGFPEFDDTAYELMCRHGKRIAPQMADDNHNSVEGDYFAGTFGGFNMINCDSLKYENVIYALERGDFYCSQAPEIKNIFVQEDKVCIETSDACDIVMLTGIRVVKRKTVPKGQALSYAEFLLNNEYKYIRFEITDNNKKKAFSRAYFIYEWFC